MKRDPVYIKSLLYMKDGKIYCKEKCIIEFPKWYEDKELASMQEVSYVYGIFAIIVGDKYSVSIIPTLCAMVPIMVNEVERNGVVYTQFVYGKDDCIIDSVSVVKRDILSYNFFESYYMYARVPWFVEYEDLVRVMDSLFKYGASKVGDNWLANELTSSFITRSKSNKNLFYRQVQKGEYDYVDLMNVFYSARGTVHGLAGGYFQNGLVSNIVQQKKESTKLEQVVR